MIDSALFAANRKCISVGRLFFDRIQCRRFDRAGKWFLQRLMHGSLSCLLISLVVITTMSSRSNVVEFDRHGAVSGKRGTAAAVIGFKLLDYLMFSVAFAATHVTFGYAILITSVAVMLVRNMIQEVMTRASNLTESGHNSGTHHHALSLS